jgi:hypothetical protein
MLRAEARSPGCDPHEQASARPPSPPGSSGRRPSLGGGGRQRDGARPASSTAARRWKHIRIAQHDILDYITSRPDLEPSWPDHSACHVGEFAILRRVMGTWPPDRAG